VQENSSAVAETEATPSLEQMLSAALAETDSSSPPPETAASAEETGEQVSTETAATTTEVEAPAEMSAEQRVAFKTLPIDAQRQVAERYAEVRRTLTQKTEEISKDKAKIEEFEKVFEPHRQQLELQGITPAQAASRLLAAQRLLEQNPIQGFNWLAKSLGVDLRQLAPQPDKEEEFLDPEVKALKDEVSSLRAELNQQKVGTQTAKAQEVQKIISDFKTAKDEAGNLKHPHFENPDVQAVISGLVGQGKTLAEAYERAVFVLPEVRTKIAEDAAKAAQAEATKKAEEARKQKLVAAKTAAQTIRSRGTAEEKTPNVSIEDALRAAMREASA
jgi:hypothetical protein